MQFRHQFDEIAAKAASDETGLLCEDPSLTVQSDAEDADINTIVRRFGITGSLPQGIRIPDYADYEGIFDFQSAQNAIIAAKEAFYALPADVRAEFANDPQQLLQFAADPANRERLVQMGLADPQAAPAAPPAPVDVPPATPPSPPTP